MEPVTTVEVLDLEVSGVAHGGWCVARDSGGRVVFVRHALPGERVRARVTDATASFARAEAIEVLRASPDRVEPRCPHARPGGCGGCDWQHADLAAQRRLKAEVIGEQLRRIAGLDREVTVEPVAGDDDGLGWRTRVRFSVGPGGAAGLLAHRSHQVVEVGDCPIAHPLVRARAVTGRSWAPARSVEVVVSPASGERALIVGPATVQDAAGTGLAGEADTVLLAGRAGRLTTLGGRGSLRQHAAGRSWRVSAGAFWQVHPGAAGALSAAVLDVLRPRPGEVALDLYCGAGLFAGALAAGVGPDGMVVAIDADRTAVRDARRNLRDMPWARVHAADAAAALARGGWPPPALAVLDPPRTGVPRQVIERLLARGGGPGDGPGGGPGAVAGSLRRVAYVSCDPATLARDIAAFAGLGWRLDGLRAFDIFPMTHHVECVAALAPE
ncbi:MAG TPA: TRAM domain-containing protein [Streptosporangiaceae bacterium]|jgi:tRNA/tmRNA/rRNA uracil-C5-methylase (TrmA/RlmC/RlmD family)|nr:TRAM domain-containing protein [Streptosporangiaceae bacterium]